MDTTRQVQLQAVTPEDAAALGAMLADRDLRWRLYGGEPGIDADQARARWLAPCAGDDARFAIRCVDEQRVVGGIGVVGGELAFFVDPSRQGRGYGVAAIRALLQLRTQRGAWPGLHARTLRENLAARAALAASGFLEAGLARPARGRPASVVWRLADDGFTSSPASWPEAR